MSNTIPKFKNDTAAAKYYAEILLSDGQPKTKPEILEFITKELGRAPSKGVLSGMLYNLVKSNRGYSVFSRGIYQYTQKSQPDTLATKVQLTLAQTITSLQSEAMNVTILDATSNDLHAAKTIKGIISVLEQFMSEVVPPMENVPMECHESVSA